MKAIISIFIALLIMIVGGYSHADDATEKPKFKLSKPKATNGANDADVEIAIDNDDKKIDKDSIRITVADFKDFSQKTMDDRVVEFRRGNEYTTMIPLRDLWLTPKRKEAFEVAQVFGEKLMKVWIEKTLQIRYGGSTEALRQQMKTMSAEQIRALLAQGDQNSTMPTARDLVAASEDARDAVKKLKDRSKFFVEFDELITSFDNTQEEIFALRGLNSAKSKAVPTAFMFLASFKAPAAFIQAIAKTRYLSGVAVLLNSSINFTVAVRPWKVVKRNLDTGAIAESWYFETATQAWVLKNTTTDKLSMSGPLRLGAGLLMGDYDRMADIKGFVGGYSKSFNFKNTSLNGALPIPSNWNVKIGTVVSMAETLTQSLDITNFVKHGYFMMSKQFGFQAPQGRTQNFELGGVFNLASITDRVQLNQDTLDDLLKSVAEEIPGAEVIIRDDQIEILVPTKAESEKETSPTPVGQEPSKDQGIVLPKP